MRHFANLTELREQEGTRIGVSDWHPVGQAIVDQFAQATGDHQWIHVDPERAAAGPFGTTIAHGFMTLSLLPALMASAFDIGEVRMSINYGLNRVRFTSPVPVGSRVRGVIDLVDAADTPDGGVQLTLKVTVEIEGSERPAVVAEWLGRKYAR